MGIKQLMKLINDEAEGSFRETERSNYLGRVLAIDASMQLYQFLVQVRTAQGSGGVLTHFTNEAGEITSHLMGFFTRTINLLMMGIRPVYVFDGKSPELKLQELKKRKDLKQKAEEEAKQAEQRLEAGDKDATDDVNKANKRSTRVTKEHNDDVKKLLLLMGLPIVESPSEAEAQCAELCKKGKVYGVGTEDMDALTFGCPILLRKLNLEKEVREIHLDKVLALLGLTMDEFIDLCILCGCDYAPSIRGIGPKTALKLIKEHKTIEKVVANIDTDKYAVPKELMENLDLIRTIFKTPEVKDADEIELKFSPVDEEGLIKYLVGEKGFNEDRIRSSLAKIAKSKSQTSQKRMDSFFKPKQSGEKDGKVMAFKRKNDGKDKKGAKRGRGRGRR